MEIHKVLCAHLRKSASKICLRCLSLRVSLGGRLSFEGYAVKKKTSSLLSHQIHPFRERPRQVHMPRQCLRFPAVEQQLDLRDLLEILQERVYE
jgi:hypothetical protein